MQAVRTSLRLNDCAGRPLANRSHALPQGLGLGLILVLALAAGCSSSSNSSGEYVAANARIHIYNSTADTLTVVVSPDVAPPGFSAEESAELTRTEQFDLAPGQAKTVAAGSAGAKQIQVLRPASQTGLSTTIPVPPASQSHPDYLLDLGAQGDFSLVPVAYTSDLKTRLNKDLQQKLYDEVMEQNPVVSLPSAVALQQLPHRVDGINVDPDETIQAPGNEPVTVQWEAVDKDGLDRFNTGAPLSGK